MEKEGFSQKDAKVIAQQFLLDFSKDHDKIENKPQAKIIQFIPPKRQALLEHIARVEKRYENLNSKHSH